MTNRNKIADAFEAYEESRRHAANMLANTESYSAADFSDQARELSRARVLLNMHLRGSQPESAERIREQARLICDSLREQSKAMRRPLVWQVEVLCDDTKIGVAKMATQAEADSFADFCRKSGREARVTGPAAA